MDYLVVCHLGQLKIDDTISMPPLKLSHGRQSATGIDAVRVKVEREMDVAFLWLHDNSLGKPLSLLLLYTEQAPSGRMMGGGGFEAG